MINEDKVHNFLNKSFNFQLSFPHHHHHHHHPDLLNLATLPTIFSLHNLRGSLQFPMNVCNSLLFPHFIDSHSIIQQHFHSSSLSRTPVASSRGNIKKDSAEYKKKQKKKKTYTQRENICARILPKLNVHCMCVCVLHYQLLLVVLLCTNLKIEPVNTPGQTQRRTNSMTTA